MANTDAPPHIQGTPRLEDADFIYSGLTGPEIQTIHDNALTLFTELELKAASDTIYLILGNYDTPPGDRNGPKDRLENTRDNINDSPLLASAILLEDLDETNEHWSNFYLKFRYTLIGADYTLLIAEDNDGGHELELGEVPLETTFIFKRDYTTLAIDSDLEYEKYDAMIATLFDIMDENDHLATWIDPDELQTLVMNTVKQTLHN
ncbi:hypothetical protein G6M89_14835 [Natronolimnobius sp. AArcel1]|uniref:hypothetical protein n=1 Tax=Natronolimnobius sp. AArcel1 TaxID=1679093 RepID=UPI0013EA558E|nr:hypothetical protein [Natronolimnobius sp. AArcel1]NGM70270.1 hypothetical protein [Natronolimnobius sp. AArcel1]